MPITPLHPHTHPITHPHTPSHTLTHPHTPLHPLQHPLQHPLTAGSNALHVTLESSRDIKTAAYLLEQGVDGFALNAARRSPLSMSIETLPELSLTLLEKKSRYEYRWWGDDLEPSPCPCPYPDPNPEPNPDPNPNPDQVGQRPLLVFLRGHHLAAKAER